MTGFVSGCLAPCASARIKEVKFIRGYRDLPEKSFGC